MDDNTLNKEQILAVLKKCFINPGVMYKTNRWSVYASFLHELGLLLRDTSIENVKQLYKESQE